MNFISNNIEEDDAFEDQYLFLNLRKDIKMEIIEFTRYNKLKIKINNWRFIYLTQFKNYRSLIFYLLELVVNIVLFNLRN